MTKSFDVFLSHNSKDKPAVLELAEALRARGLKVWLDKWELVPGRPWQEALEDVIVTCRSSAVLVGKDGLGPWHAQEVRGCLAEFVRRELPVIPVLLPGAPAEPRLPFFMTQVWVDLRSGLTEEGLDNLQWGITGKRPDRSKLLSIPTAAPETAVTVAEAQPAPRSALLTVELVQDYRSPDILSALELYDKCIPDRERFEGSDILRWLREGEDEHYFFVAKRQNHVCGFALLHVGPRWPLAFIAYMGAEQRPRAGFNEGTTAAYLIEEMAKLFNSGERLARCEAILLEVDDPRSVTSEKERQKRIARLRLFCVLAAREGFLLRALDFDYRQPMLRVPKEGERLQEESLLLMLAVRPPIVGDSRLGKARVQGILEFIYQWLYPSGFSNVTSDADTYRLYLDELCAAQIANLPDSIQTLSLGEIRAQCDVAQVLAHRGER